MRRLSIGMVVIVAISVVAGVFWQQKRLERASMRIAELEGRIAQEIPALEKENESLREQLGSTTARMESNLSELLRSRGQGVKMRQLEQENARLRDEGSRLTEQLNQLSTARLEPTDSATNLPAIEQASLEVKATALASIAAEFPNLDSSQLVFSRMLRRVMAEGEEVMVVTYELPSSSETRYYDSPGGRKVEIKTRAFEVVMSSSGNVERVSESGSVFIDDAAHYLERAPN